MPYATQADLEARFGTTELAQLTDRVAGTTINATVITAALADADALIEGYLAQRYALPVSPVPQLLLRVACDIARFLLHGKAATEKVRAAYDDALKVLRDLADGRAALPGAAAAPSAQAPAAAGGAPQVAAPTRIFDRTSLGDYLG
jgi:phage gp36-like protein